MKAKGLTVAALISILILAASFSALAGPSYRPTIGDLGRLKHGGQRTYAVQYNGEILASANTPNDALRKALRDHPDIIKPHLPALRDAASGMHWLLNIPNSSEGLFPILGVGAIALPTAAAATKKGNKPEQAIGARETPSSAPISQRARE